MRCFVVILSVAACADSAPDERLFRVETSNDTVRGVFALPDGALAFREPIGGALTEQAVTRSLAWLDAGGALRAETRAATGELFIDAVAHPSGEATLFLADAEGCALRRYSPAGALVATTRLTDMDLTTDPTDATEPPPVPWNVGGCQPTEIRATGRLAADGENVYLVNRGGSSGTILFHHTYAGGAFQRTLRLPLFPRHAAATPTGIIASHRVLHSTHWSFIPRVVVDDAGQARVLFVFGGGCSPEVYNRFAPTPVGDTASAVVVTVSRAGAIVGARELVRGLTWPGHVAEIEAMRWLRGGIVLAGRVAPAPLPDDGHGWDGFVFHAVDGDPSPGLAAKVDLDRSDAISDIGTLDDGWIVAARSGYWQNPRGASISEEARGELVVLDDASQIARRIDLPQGPRHNAALSVAPGSTGHVLVGGLTNGPGSHSADGDPALLAADGWVARVAID